MDHNFKFASKIQFESTVQSGSKVKFASKIQFVSKVQSVSKLQFVSNLQFASNWKCDIKVQFEGSKICFYPLCPTFVKGKKKSVTWMSLGNGWWWLGKLPIVL